MVDHSDPNLPHDRAQVGNREAKGTHASSPGGDRCYKDNIPVQQGAVKGAVSSCANRADIDIALCSRRLSRGRCVTSDAPIKKGSDSL